jgi:hypothetical protein
MHIAYLLGKKVTDRQTETDMDGSIRYSSPALESDERRTELTRSRCIYSATVCKGKVSLCSYAGNLSYLKRFELPIFQCWSVITV